MKLRELQVNFRKAVTGDTDSEIRQFIHAGQFESGRRLQIYSNNIKITLLESLAANFPVSEAVVGKEYFKFLARKYITEHPPTEGNLQRLGELLPDFIQSQKELDDFPYLADIARMDWACLTATHSPAAESVGLDSLAHYTPDEHESLLFRLKPSVSILASSYPVFDIWKFALSEVNDTDAPDFEWAEQYVLIVRNDLEVEVFKLEQEAYILLEQSRQNKNLGSIIPYIMEVSPDSNLEVALHHLFMTGAIAEVLISDQ